MAKTIEKIIVSITAPTDTGMMWYNPESKEFRVFTNGDWTLVSGGGGGGESNLLIGTREDRLKLVPYNGLEFNEVDEDDKVHLYLYDKNEWVLLSNPIAHDTEEVVFSISSTDGELVVSTVQVEVTDDTTGVAILVEIDSAGTGIIQIPIGHEYTIRLPQIEHFFLDSYEFHYTASQYTRPISIVYRHSYSDFESVAKSFIVEASADPTCTTGGSDVVLNRILEGGNLPGTYVIDEEHKKFARLTLLTIVSSTMEPIILGCMVMCLDTFLRYIF